MNVVIIPSQEFLKGDRITFRLTAGNWLTFIRPLMVGLSETEKLSGGPL